MDQTGIPNEKPEKKGFSLFKKKEEAPTGPAVSDASSQITSIDRRMRILEERNSDLNRRVQLIDKSRIDERKLFNREIKTMDSEILELKRDLNSIKNKMELIIAELKDCSRKDEVDALRKYIDLWEPVNFATRNEVEKIIDEKIAELKEKKP